MQPCVHLIERPEFNSLRSIGFSTQRFPRFVNANATLHSHDVVELFMVLEGNATHLMAGNESQPLQTGDLGIVNFGQSHVIVTPPAGIGVVNVYIDPRWAGLPPLSPDLAAALPRVLPIAPGMSHNQNRVCQYRLPEAERVAAILLALADEAEKRRPGYLDAMLHYMHLFIIECARFAQEHFRTSPLEVSGSMAAIERVRRHLDDNWREDLRLDDIAARARMSKAHLCRLFRKYTGRTIVEYLHHRRVERAMMLLNSTEEKIITVAHESGFGDLAHFNRVFRRIAGQTPSEFRQAGNRALSPAV